MEGVFLAILGADIVFPFTFFFSTDKMIEIGKMKY